MKFIIASLLAGLLGISSAAQGDSGKRLQEFVKISKTRELYVDWMKARDGKPTLVLLNGLTYSTYSWDRYAEALNRQGYGVLRYDMFGMGRTLLKYAPITTRIELKDQTGDLRALLVKLGLTKINLAGLSYGGGIAIAFTYQYPEMINKLILLAPFTEPVEAQDKWIKQQIWLTRQSQPWNPSSDDDLYDFFLKQIVYSTYPAAEPVVLENPWKLESVYRLVQGVRKWNAFDEAKLLPVGSVHMVIAGKDQYIDRAKLEKFWKIVPKSSRASLMTITDSEHKIPEDVPEYAAAWTIQILDGNPNLVNGHEFAGSSDSQQAKGSGGVVIDLPTR